MSGWDDAWASFWDPNYKQTGLGNKLTDRLNGVLDKPAPYFNQSLFTGAGDTTHDAWTAGTRNANSLINSNGMNRTQANSLRDLGGVRSGYNALGDNNGLTTSQGQNQTALKGIGQGYAGLSGAYDQNAPGYQAFRTNLMNDAVKNVGAGFIGSGRFGGGSYTDTATTSAVDAVAPLDYQNFQNGINNKYQSLDRQAGIQNNLFGNAQTGVGNTFGALAGRAGVDGTQFGMGQQAIDNRNGAIGQLGAIGAAQDANRQGYRMGASDLYDRQHNAELNRLQQVGGIFNGSGASSTQNQPQWWQQALGYVANNAGQAAKAYAGGGG